MGLHGPAVFTCKKVSKSHWSGSAPLPRINAGLSSLKVRASGARPIGTGDSAEAGHEGHRATRDCWRETGTRVWEEAAKSRRAETPPGAESRAESELRRDSLDHTGTFSVELQVDSQMNPRPKCHSLWATDCLTSVCFSVYSLKQNFQFEGRKRTMYVCVPSNRVMHILIQSWAKQQDLSLGQGIKLVFSFKKGN